MKHCADDMDLHLGGGFKLLVHGLAKQPHCPLRIVQAVASDERPEEPVERRRVALPCHVFLPEFPGSEGKNFGTVVDQQPGQVGG